MTKAVPLTDLSRAGTAFSLSLKIAAAVVAVGLIGIAVSTLITTNTVETDFRREFETARNEITRQIATNIGGAMRWKKPDIIAQSYGQLLEDPKKPISALVTVTAGGELMTQYAERDEDAARLADLAKQEPGRPENAPRTVYLGKDFVSIAPSGKDARGRPYGYLAIAWKTDAIDRYIDSTRVDLITKLSLIMLAVIGVLLIAKFAAAAEIKQERLQAAVTNMPAGLCMFDASERLIICNAAYAKIYKLPPELAAPGTSLQEILRNRIEAGIFPVAGPDTYKAQIATMVATPTRTVNILELSDGRTISTALQPMAGGGWVGVHEDITERRRAEARIAYMAHHDSLTDLANRVLFRERLASQLAGGDKLAVMCLDLDRFKAVNDTLGHPVGDALLKMVAERLKICVREEDIIARFGGDEFAVVQIGAEQPDSAAATARRIIEAVSAPYNIEDHQIVIGVSIGIAFAPDDGAAPDMLLKNADLALYRAKCDGRGTFHTFEPIMDARMQARRRLELDLRKALAENEFELFYQPVVDIEGPRITSFEALLRWHHPERGLVSPGEFIPLAEEIGFIIPLGDWILRRACADATRWPNAVKVSVNLSPAQFRNAKLLQSVQDALSEAGLSARRLELEITEGVLLAETEATLAMLNQLHMLGVQIAMDDFGTGYSSLSYFRSFRFDRIKIDRSFVQNISGDDSALAVIRAVSGLSASLGMATTAEGVETEEQMQRLRAEGCKELQGFFFSPPRPASEIAQLLKTINQSEAAA
jgi:diguanylate cyclase (GGDEF)-like protein